MGPHASPRNASAHDAGQILDALRRIVQRLRIADKEAQTSAGIPTAQLFVLSRIGDRTITSVRELADSTLTDPSSVSEVLSKLEARRFVSRTVDAKDRRKANIKLTASGRKVLLKAGDKALPQVRLIDAVATLSSPQRKRIVGALADLTAALNADQTKAHLFFEDSRAPRKQPRTTSKGRGRAR